MATQSPAPGETGINWESSEIAERRSRGQARRVELQGPATEMMLDLAAVRTGSRVLDVAAGTGDQTPLAAQRVGPNGYVLATDISASMLKLAADAAREAGLTNVETRVMDAENIDLDADSFDNVTVRPVSFRRHYSSTAEMIRRLKEGALLRAPIEKLGEAERQKAWAEIERQMSQLQGPNGVEMPGEFLIGAGTKWVGFSPGETQL